MNGEKNSMQRQTTSDWYTILGQIMRLCRDDGRHFTNTGRLDEIQRILWNSRYRRVNPLGLFHLYAARPLDQIEGPVVLVSSHVDCAAGISHCFCEEAGDNLLRGTFDNAATNAAILSLMQDDSLPDCILVAFTGDEEEDSRGISETVRFLRARHIDIDLAVVLDVTGLGWNEHAGFTIENNFWDGSRGSKVIECIGRLDAEWRFVSGDPENIPAYVPLGRVIFSAAQADESWQLHNLDIPCFSLCLPVQGSMHSDSGVLARRTSFADYCAALKAVLREWEPVEKS